ncbi:methyl-accepting chemotaxis protein, partial [bacterium]|nr:methyl-accepting chemotaxis protein [bacterium]
MFKSRYLRLSTKILLNSAAIIVCFCLVVGWLARSLRDEIVAEKVAALSQLVEVAHSQLVEYDERVRSGELTVADAQEQARQRLRNLRYEGKEYFWINDRTPVMVMHPYKPELEGKSLENTADPDGRYLFREMVAVCREKGEGVVRYRWPHPESTAPVAKLSYVKEFEPWGWIVGTGIYIDGLNRQLASTLIPVLVFSLLAAAGSFAVSVFTSRSITRPIGEGVAFARDLAAGDLTRQLDLRRRDEVGALAESLNRMGADLQMMISDIADGVRTLSASSTELLF